jgi:hypothetical protein
MENKMKQKNFLMAISLIIISLLLSACAERPEENEGKEESATVRPVEGMKVSSVTLTEDAIKRLDIQSARVYDEQISGKKRKVIPYAAVLYDPEGDAWVFTNPEPMVFVRQSIKIDYIKNDRAILFEGPPSGTAVVTVGAAELFGAEIGVGE